MYITFSHLCVPCSRERPGLFEGTSLLLLEVYVVLAHTLICVILPRDGRVEVTIRLSFAPNFSD